MRTYVAPKSVVLSMNMKENIAASFVNVTWNAQYYLKNGVIQDTGYIYNVEAGGAYYDAMMAWLGKHYSTDVFDCLAKSNECATNPMVDSEE